MGDIFFHAVIQLFSLGISLRRAFGKQPALADDSQGDLAASGKFALSFPNLSYLPSFY
jgi:hypothetical protein